MAIQIPTGYAGLVPLSITNPSTTTALGGSTTTPVAASATDYVVTCALSGGQAAAVSSGALDQTAFTDVTAWWTDPGGVQHQLDVDYDTTTNGAWSAAQVTLRFRLQAPIAAGGSDAAYFVAFGHPDPVVLRDWANVYPFADAFAGTTLSSGRWRSNVPAGCSLACNDGLTLSVPAGNGGQCYVVSTGANTFGPGRMLEWLGAVTPVAGSGTLWALAEWGTADATPLAALGALAAGPGSSKFYLYVHTSGGTSQPLVHSPADGSTHWWRLARDPAGLCYPFVDGYSATAPGTAVTTTLPVCLLAWPYATTTVATQVVAQWLKVRPWAGPGLDPTVAAGALVYRSGTALTSTPAAGPLVRAGAPSIVRRDAGTWLALYSDGAHASSRVGGTVAALAAAADSAALAPCASLRGAALLSAQAGTVVAVAAQDGGAPAVAVYSGAPASWAAGSASGLPSGAVFAGDTYTDSGSGQTYWHLLAAQPGGTSIGHWVATAAGGPLAALSSATVVALPSGSGADPCLAAAGYAGALVAAAINGQGYVTYATLDALAATSGGSTVVASTLALSNGALATGENLALLTSLEGGAGDLYVAYNNNLGLCVRSSAAGGPLSWSAETQVSSTAGDACPTLARDDSGGVTLFWVGAASGNPVLSQRLQVVGGTVFLTGATLQQTNYAAQRSLLSCVPAEPSGLVGLVWLES